MRRRQRGLAPFTVVTCNNMPGNGQLADAVSPPSPGLRDPELGDWIEDAVRFPNSMVDRITPVTTDADRAEVARPFGSTTSGRSSASPSCSGCSKTASPPGGRPYEDAGVQLVGEVEPYELMKLRLLNASHQALCYLPIWRVTGWSTRPPRIRCSRRSFSATWRGRPTPDAPARARGRPGRIQADLLERFANPQIRDTIARLCAQSSDRIPKFLLPVIRQQLATGGEIKRSAAVVASWARYAEGVDEQGQPIDVVDRYAGRLTSLARRQRGDPTAFIANRDLFGDLADDERFTAYRSALASLHQRGARATLQAAVGLLELVP